MPYFLALDAGGTKTDYLLADETRVLARVRSGSVKRMRVDQATAVQNLEASLAELTRLSGVSMREVARTCVGTAGESVPLVADWFRVELPARVGGGLLLLGDVEIALDAAFPGAAGVLVLAGTGSNVAGRTRGGGAVQTAGGWGPALADQGSGHRIGQEALRAVFLARDEGRETSLLPAALAFWGLPSIAALVEYANRVPGPDFSQLTHVVLRCAEAGDALAKDVLHGGGEELATLVRALLRRLAGEAPSQAFAPELAFAGSILESVLPVRTALVAAVRRAYPALVEKPGVVDPILGALWRARLADGCA